MTTPATVMPTLRERIVSVLEDHECDFYGLQEDIADAILAILPDPAKIRNAALDPAEFARVIYERCELIYLDPTAHWETLSGASRAYRVARMKQILSKQRQLKTPADGESA